MASKSTKLKHAPSAPSQVPALEIDEASQKLYLLEQTIPLGPDFKKLQARREIYSKEFTLDARTLEVLDVLSTGVNQKLPTLLEGPTAASKTSAIEYLSTQAGYTCHRINLKGQTDTSEFIGKFVPNPDAKPGEPQLKWQDGLVVKAMKEGHWVILDEINLAGPIIEVLNSVLEKHPSITLTDNDGIKVGPGGDYPVHTNFRLFATMNPGYTGRQPLSPAFQNRWVNRSHVSAPDRHQLESMLIHQAYGQQPKVTFKSETYHSTSTENLSHLSRIRELPELPIKTLFSRLAIFHEAIAKMADEKTIGRDLDPGHIFTRRDLSVFLDYIDTKESFNRQKAKSKNLLTDPVTVIMEALQIVYLNKMSAQDDLNKIKALLTSSHLDESALKKLFPESGIKNTVRSKIAGLLDEDQGGDSDDDDANEKPRTSNEIPPEVEALREKLEADYQEQIDSHIFYDLIQEDPENPGRYFYQADYDGSTEADGKGQDFSGEKFTMPQFSEILSSITPDQAKLYQEMIEKGEQPQLKLTPIALKLRTLAEKLDGKKAEINTKAGRELIKNPTYIWEKKENGDIDESKLQYESTNFEAIESGQKLQIRGGKTKSELIRENDGWLIDIIATKSELTADPDKVNDSNGHQLYTATKTALYMTESLEKGTNGLCYENYLNTQMIALRKGQFLDYETYSILPESGFTNTEIVAVGRWSFDRVYLRGYDSDLRGSVLRFRRSVRVKRS